MTGRSLCGAAVALAVSLALSAPAAAAPVSAYDGTNPFDCVLQQAGLGTTVPHPEADPYCVEFEKRSQNVTDLGVVDFLSKEPARVSAASDKCFYFQHDHWRGSVVQDDESTETYNWDGYYYFDKAKGMGGAYVENFTVNNQTQDPRDLPGFPEDQKPYFGPGRGGVHKSEEVDSDPRCIAAAKKKSPYAKKRGPGSPAKKPPNACGQRDGAGAAGRSVGDATLGISRRKLEQRLGEPATSKGAMLQYCVPGGLLLVGFPSGKDESRAQFIATTSKGFHVKQVRRGTSSKDARERLSGERKLMRRGSYTVLALDKDGFRVLFGLRANRVRYLAVVSSKVSRKRLARYLYRSDRVRKS